MPKTFALSLSGGGAKAFAYYGFIRGLEQGGLVPDLVYAHSGAAWLLCYLASGLPDEEVVRRVGRFRLWHYMSLNPLGNRGLLRLSGLVGFLRGFCGERRIEDLPWPTRIAVSDFTDMNHPRPVFHAAGDLASLAVQSSIIPPLFPLWREEGRLYADGAYTSLFGAPILREMGADVIVGLYPDALKDTKLPGIVADWSRLVKAQLSAREAYERREHPIELEVRDFSLRVGLHEYARAAEIFEAGWQEAGRRLPQIRQLLAESAEGSAR